MFTGLPSGVYMIRNNLDLKRYIGSSMALEQRRKEHLAWGCSSNRHLQAAISRDGVESFSWVVLEQVEPTQLIAREQLYLDFYPWDQLYNFCPKAGNTFGRKPSEETKRKISIANTGRKLSLETRDKIRIANIGRKHSEETKKKMSKVQLARFESHSGSMKGKRFTEDHKMKLAASKRGEGNPSSKLTWDQVREMRSVKNATQQELSETYGVSRGTVGKILRGEKWRVL